MSKEDVKKGYLAAMATMEVEPEYAEQYWESYESSQHWIKDKSKLKNIGVIGDAMICKVLEDFRNKVSSEEYEWDGGKNYKYES